MMNRKQISVWIPVGFSAVLCIGTAILNVIGPNRFGGMSAGMPAFFSFLPTCFFFAADALRDTRSEIEALEARIKQLESEKAA